MKFKAQHKLTSLSDAKGTDSDSERADSEYGLSAATVTLQKSLAWPALEKESCFTMLSCATLTSL